MSFCLKLRANMKPWSNLATLKLKALMKRRKKDGQKEESPVEKLLAPIKRLELCHDNESDVSEISDVFEEFHRNSYLRPQDKHYLTKHEADIKTIEEFTEDFKKTMLSLREDLNIGKQLFSENVDEIEEIFEGPKHPEIFPKISINKAMTEMLDDSSYSIPSPQDLKQSRKISNTSTTSIFWHMLAVNSDNKKFQISPPGYNIFREKKPHWLQRASVSWQEIDQSKLKCENWLQQQCQ